MAICKRIQKCYNISCANQQPGINELYLLNYSDLDSIVLDVDGKISGLTYEASLITDDNWLTFQLPRELADFISANEINIQNSTSINRPKLNFKLAGLDQDVLDLYDVLKESSVICVIEMVSGELMMVGTRNGMSATTLSLGTEASANSFKGLTVGVEGLNETLYILGDAFKETFKATHLKVCV